MSATEPAPTSSESEPSERAVDVRSVEPSAIAPSRAAGASSTSLAELFRGAPPRRDTEREPEPEELFLAAPETFVAEPAPRVAKPSIARRMVGAAKSFLEARITIGFLLQASLAFAVAHFLLFNLSVVRGSSMNPGIHDGDRIVIDHWAYVFGDVHRGDVVVLKYPLDPNVDYIKRVIGLPGDEVTLESGHVWVNGVELPEPYVADEDLLARLNVRVKPAHFFVLGDNRPRSSDSRDFGQVPCEYVRGKVEVRLWPPERIGAVR